MDILNIIVAVAGGIVTIATCAKLVFSPLKKFVERSDKNDEQMQKTLVQLSTKIDKIEEKVDSNEKDRIRAEIFKYGNIARQHRPISAEEFASLRTDFIKYSEELHGNGIAHDEWLFVQNYYNCQFE